MQTHAREIERRANGQTLQTYDPMQNQRNITARCWHHGEQEKPNGTIMTQLGKQEKPNGALMTQMENKRNPMGKQEKPNGARMTQWKTRET